ncbi:hypothetical protein [Oceanidesulfovibrio marinus]|uniref:Uncharacterized protein n=1 Tax=Oceanidesulfovibrio marinus TaxID=370038 RepID=A0A6P1ZH22_9BACT|nr:hypothetical protein [Oceanidesulfovibrio marinus]TVM33688.1 hypothetical protein DQK91_10710 [Oceanidesulfovibrio marinus]
MDITLYESFTDADEKGLKDRAKAFLRAFIDSFADEKEKEIWVWRYLEGIDVFREYIKLRYEIFEELVFPVLFRGFQSDHQKSLMWLGLLIPNLNQSMVAEDVREEIIESKCLVKAVELDPEDYVAKAVLLLRLIDAFEYVQHEWPNGLVYYYKIFDLQKCAEFKSKVALARELDVKKQYGEFLDKFEERIKTYERRFRERLE